MIRHHQANQAVKVITVKMTDENMIDFAEPNIIFSELHLSSFAAISQKQPVQMIDQLRCGMSFGQWRGRIATQNSYGEI
jgi:hypothetical protein